MTAYMEASVIFLKPFKPDQQGKETPTQMGRKVWTVPHNLKYLQYYTSSRNRRRTSNDTQLH